MMTRVRSHRRRIGSGTTNVAEHTRSGKIPNTVQIFARRWFAKTYGNTYHSVVVYVDNVEVGREDFTYGYGEQYRQTAFELLQKAGYFKGKTYYDFLNWKRDKQGRVVEEVSDVERKKDL